MDREHANLTTHDAYAEVPEDSLSTWDAIKRRAREVIKTLWVPVLVRKRDGDANLLCGDAAYKGRCVVDGANQKSTAIAAGKEIFGFMPTVRTATNKTQCAHACQNKRRITNADIKSAYLKGKFEDDEIVHVRPPPNAPGQSNYRTFDERGVPIVLRLKVPLYGEVDAGAIFYRTLRKQLVNH